MKKQDVIRYFGDQTSVAAALGIEQSAVSQWGELIPEKRAVRLERLADGVERNGVVLSYEPALYDKKSSAA